MKRILIAVVGIVASASVLGQGALNFSTVGVAASTVYDVDGTTKLGADYQATLLIGKDCSSLAPVTTTLFKTGSFLGQVNAGAQSTGTDWGATVFYKIQVWKVGSMDFATASKTPGEHVGESACYSILLPSPPPNPTPPKTTFTVAMSVVPIPEPSAIALGVLGGLGLFLLRRRS